MTRVSALNVVAIQKSAGVPFLEAVFDAYERARCVALVEGVGGSVPGLTFAETIVPQSGGGWFSRRLKLPHDALNVISQISLTSGTTGVPKAIALTQGALADVSDRLVDAMEMDGSIREYVGVPVTFSFGLGRVRAVTQVGGKAYIPEIGFQPAEFAEMLARGEVNALSVVPTQLRLLFANAELFTASAGKLRWMEIGSQFLSAEEKQRVRSLFPNAIILQHYGLTEASRSTFLRIDNASEGDLASVGAPTGRVEVRIGADRHIEIRGPHVASGLVTERGLTPLTDADGWLRTNDLGSFRGGLLYYEGRSDDQINIGGIKVGAEFLERLLVERTNPGEIAVAARHDALRGESVLIVRTPNTTVADKVLRGSADDILQSMGIRAGQSVMVALVDRIPRTSTGKVQRHLLPDLVQGSAPDAAIAPADAVSDLESAATGDAAALEAQLIKIWEEALGVHSIGRDQSFFDVGGDSLTAITIMMRMERLGIDRRVSQQIFEGRTIAEIAADSPRTEVKLARMAEAINVTRGLLALWLVAIHWLPFFFERAGSLAEPLKFWSTPLFRFGTPGFAIIFGVGVGFFHFHVFSRSPSIHFSRTLRNSALLAVGVFIVAVFIAVEILLTEGAFGPQWPTELFYSVLLFYTLMIATAPAFLWILNRSSQKIVTALTLAVVFFALSQVTRYFFGDADTTGFTNLVRLTFMANYSYFDLGGMVFTGTAAGIALRKHHADESVVRILIQLGLVLACWGVVVSVTTGSTGAWTSLHVVSQAMEISYVGFVSILLGLTYALNATRRYEGPFGVLARVIAVVGVLSLLMFVAHGAVIPLKSILAALGLGEGIGRLLAVLAFLAVMSLAVHKTYRRYYG